MEKPAQNSISLELHVPDFEKVKEFYGKLGFEVIWEREPEEKKGYLVLKKENNILCFWAGNQEVWNQNYFKKYSKNTKRGYAVEIVIMVENVKEFYQEVKKFAKVVSKLATRPWGLSDFRIEDPFGFYIRFTDPHNILDSKYAIP